MFQYFTTIPFLREMCIQNFPEQVKAGPHFLENCALAKFKLRDNYRQSPVVIYDGDYEEASDIYQWCCNQIYLVNVVFVLMYYAGVKLQQKTVWTIIVLLNLVMGVKEVFSTDFRFGVDYAPYIQQASVVYNGERDYRKISSTNGPCYYPAGHFIVFIPVYLLHMNTIHAEEIMKFVHLVAFIAIQVLASRIVYIYFTSKTEKEGKNVNLRAQTIALIIVGCLYLKPGFRDMFNDLYMIMQILFAVLLLIKDKPVQAAFVLSFSIS